MNKVIVIGGSGSGKSTFARKLRDVTGLPLYHLDNVFWNEDKTHVSREVFDRRLDVILGYKRFIIDGEYGRTIERRIAAADTIFFFDIPLKDRLDGAVARVGIVHPDLPWTEEKFDPEFEKWIREYDTDQRPVTLALLDKYKEKNIIVFKSRKESDDFLKNIGECKKEKLPVRKPNRLQNFDYSKCGAYFLTICTSKRINYFWKNQPNAVGATSGRPDKTELSQYGKTVDEAVNNIPVIYQAVNVDHYVIMPDHIHLLLSIRSDERGRPMVAPTISRIVKQMKGYVTKQIGKSIWQKLFYDHVIRNKEDYEKHVKYIYENPFCINFEENR